MHTYVGAPVKPLRAHNSRGSMEPLFPYTPDQLYSIPGTYFAFIDIHYFIYNFVYVLF